MRTVALEQLTINTFVLFRLADYLILSTLHHMVVDSLTILLQTLNVLIEASPSDEAIMAWNTVKFLIREPSIA